MGILLDPQDPLGARRPLLEAMRHGALLVSLMAWSTIALGLAQSVAGPLWLLAVVGVLAALFAQRWFHASLAVECGAYALVLTLAPSAGLGWLVTGGLLALLARALVLVVRARL